MGPVAADETYLDDDRLITGEAVALDLRPASFVLRAAGAAIDFVALILAFYAVASLLSSPLLAPLLDPAAQAAVTLGLLVVLVIVVPTVVETLTGGRSLGKLAVGVRVVRDDGGAIGVRHALIRALVGLLEVISTLGAVAALVGLLNSRSKRLGDLLAGTYAQHERIPAPVESVLDVPPELAAWARTADVARLPDRLARRIASFLRQSGGMSPESRARLSLSLAAEASAYASPVPDVHPEAFLLGVAALRRDREYAALLLERERMAPLGPALSDLPHGFPDRD